MRRTIRAREKAEGTSADTLEDDEDAAAGDGTKTTVDKIDCDIMITVNSRVLSIDHSCAINSRLSDAVDAVS